MNRDFWLLTLLALLSAYNAGAVWLAQISGYPLWPHVGQGEFSRYYAVWSGSATVLLSAPLLLTLAASAVVLWMRPRGVPGWTLWTCLLLQATVVALTFLWWTPSAAHLTTADGSLNPTAFARLARTHWLRVALVTTYASLCWWMLGRNLLPREPGPLPAKGWLLLLTVAFGLMGAGQVWIVQTLCYKVWPYVGRSAFCNYHLAWWRSIWTAIFIPAGITLVGVFALLRWRPPQTDVWLVWAGIGLQILLGTLTSIWWGPLMARLATRVDGLLMDRYNLLMSTHWWRVAIVTAYGLTALWMLVHTASGSCVQPNTEVRGRC